MNFNPYDKMSLNTKLRWLILAGPCLVLALTALVYSWFTYRELFTQGKHEASSETYTLARQVDDFFDRAAVLTRSIASRQRALGKEPNKQTPGILRSLLRSIVGSEKRADGRRTIDPTQGVYIAFEQRPVTDPEAFQWVDRDQLRSGETKRIGYDYHNNLTPEREWYWGAKNENDGVHHISEPYFDTDGAEGFMVSVTEPIRFAGEFVAVAGVDLDMERLRELVQDRSKQTDREESSRAAGGGVGDYAYLLSAQGRVFALPDSIQEELGFKRLMPIEKDELQRLHPNALPGHAKVETMEEGTFEEVYTRSGELRLVSWRRLSTAPNWKVVLNKSGRPVLEARKRVASNSLAFGVVALAVMIGIVAFAADRVTGPIPVLRDAAAAVEAGDYRADGLDRVARRLDEFGQLARGFQRMVDEVANREGQLQKAQGELAGRERHYRALIENATDIVTVLGPGGVIQYKSPSVQRILGWQPSELLGRPALMFIHPDDHETVRSVIFGLTEPGATAGPVQYHFQHADGSWRVLEAYCTNLGDDPAVGGIVINSREVTERIEADQAIRQLNADLEVRVRRRTAELEQTNEELHAAKEATDQAMTQQEVFLSNVAHDLRTPLTIVIGFSEDLLRRAKKKQIDAFVPDLQLIVNRGKDLLEMINDLLNLSKSMNDKDLGLDLEEYDVAEMVRGRMEGISSIAQKYGNSIEFRPDDGLGTMVADRAKVWRILMNLLTNSCKFTKDGTITVTASRVRFVAGDRVVMTVSDTGIGMSPDKQKRLFNRFAQVHAGEISGNLGASFGLSSVGLGLSICMLYCRAMGGRITVESEEGRGSTFTVELPAVVRAAARPASSLPAQAPAVALAAPPASNGSGAVAGPARLHDPDSANLILIIDDDASICELIARNLGEEGFQTRAAHSGEDGLRLAKQLLPSAIVLDVVMPGIDGWAVLAALKTDSETAEIPIVMVSMLDERDRGLRMGADDYLTKPFAHDRLPGLLARKLGHPKVGRVIVVEDDTEARELLSRTLREQGWEVVACGDGDEAVRLMEGDAPDLMLLDLLLPTMDGFEVIDKVRGNPNWKATPIIVMTAAALDPEARRRLQEKVEQVLYKGLYSRDELLREIRTMVGQHKHTMHQAPAESSHAQDPVR